MANHSNRERIRLLSAYGHLYSRHIADHLPYSLGCFYCADVASDIDHCPPIRWIEAKKPKQWRQSGIEFLTVRACKWCNQKLGAKALFTLGERAEYIEEALMQQYEKEAHLWSEAEILQMSPEFQRTIRARQRATQELLTRARAAEWRKVREMAGF